MHTINESDLKTPSNLDHCLKIIDTLTSIPPRDLSAHDVVASSYKNSLAGERKKIRACILELLTLYFAEGSWQEPEFLHELVQLMCALKIQFPATFVSNLDYTKLSKKEQTTLASGFVDLKTPVDVEFWEKWVAHNKQIGTLAVSWCLYHKPESAGSLICGLDGDQATSDTVWLLLDALWSTLTKAKKRALLLYLLPLIPYMKDQVEERVSSFICHEQQSIQVAHMCRMCRMYSKK